LVATNICYKSHKIEYFENGNIKSEEGGFNWGGTHNDNSGDDNLEIANEYLTYDGIKFSADDIFISYIEEDNKCIPQPKLAQIQITTNNKKFEIYEK
jgi:hypothetical protein